MFDPYHKWLGILPRDQPPNHYRLLGVERFEKDLDVIEGAADRQMAYIRQYQSGEHATAAAQILNELAAARLCLLKPKRKSAYDEHLRTLIDPSESTFPPEVVPAELPLLHLQPETLLSRPVSKQRSSQTAMAAFVVLVLVAASGFGLYCYLSGAQPTNAHDSSHDSDKRLVKNWLDQYEKKWKEVKWWPAIELKKLRNANARRILAQVEQDKEEFESGRAIAAADLQSRKAYYRSFERREVRRICAMEYQIVETNGAKVTYAQAFELESQRAIPLKGNLIVEFPAFNGQEDNDDDVVKHHAWKFLQDPGYDPDPEDPQTDLGTRFAAAFQWKSPSRPKDLAEAPAEKPLIVEPEEPAVSLVEKSSHPVPSRVTEINSESVPPRAREYIERVDQIRRQQIADQEAKIQQLGISIRGASGKDKVNLRKDLEKAEKALVAIKKAKTSAKMPDNPVVGDIGSFQSLTVHSVIDLKTLAAVRNPAANIVIFPIETVGIKAGTKANETDVFRVVAIMASQSPLMEDKRFKVINFPVRFVVEPVRNYEIEAYRDKLEAENK